MLGKFELISIFIEELLTVRFPHFLFDILRKNIHFGLNFMISFNDRLADV